MLDAGGDCDRAVRMLSAQCVTMTHVRGTLKKNVWAAVVGRTGLGRGGLPVPEYAASSAAENAKDRRKGRAQHSFVRRPCWWEQGPKFAVGTPESSPEAS